MIRFRNLLAGALLGSFAMFAAEEASAVTCTSAGSVNSSTFTFILYSATTNSCSITNSYTFNSTGIQVNLDAPFDPYSYAAVGISSGVAYAPDSFIVNGILASDDADPFRVVGTFNGTFNLTVLYTIVNFGPFKLLANLTADGGQNIIVNSASVSAVPLPPALSLFGSGLAILGFIGWRRKRKAAA